MTRRDDAFDSSTLTALLRRYFPATEGTKPHNVMDFMHQFGTVPSALLYARLFMPAFQIVENHVIIDNGDGYKPARFREALQTSACPCRS